MTKAVSAKKLVHELYNDLAKDDRDDTQEIRQVLMKVYGKLDEKDPVPLVDRFVKYLYFTTLTNKISLSTTQDALVQQLAAIGKTAGLNGVYRSNYGDSDQF